MAFDAADTGRSRGREVSREPSPPGAAPLTPSAPEPRLAGLTIRAALFIGFGVTLGIWLFTGWELTRSMTALENEARTINARYMRAQDQISTARAQVLLAAVYVRDALLDPDPAAAADYRRRLRDAFRRADRALRQYVPVWNTPGERAQIERLRREVEDFRRVTLDVPTAEVRGLTVGERLQLLRDRIMPRREMAISVSEEVQSLNRSAFIKQQSDHADIHRARQSQVWWRLGLSLVAGFGVALVATLYAGLLEGRLRRQRVRDMQMTNDLQRLSARLVSAQEEERRAIARELHDEVGQALTAMKVELAVAQRAAQTRGGAIPALDNVRTIADGVLHTVRDLSRLLHPAVLDDLGLPAALDSHLRGFSKRHDIPATLLHDGMDRRLAPEVEAAIYRVVQEALTNVSKHARATSCRVELRRRGDRVSVTISDDGIGFDLGAGGAARGLGLVGMRERVSRLGGTIDIDSAFGSGTRISVDLPIGPVGGDRECLALSPRPFEVPTAAPNGSDTRPSSDQTPALATGSSGGGHG